MRLLVIEDEDKVRSFIVKGLKENGYTVDEASNGEDGLFLAENESYDCIVLDILLPKFDGYQILRLIREKNINTPVIFLTAKDAVEDRVKGFELGSDDYLVKPFKFVELLARIRALIRRGAPSSSTILQVFDLEMDLVKRKVSRSGRDIELTPKEFTLLEYLMQHEGEVVTRTILMEHVWGYHFDPNSNVIDVHINALRTKIDKEFSATLIHTRRGMGYVLEEKH